MEKDIIELLEEGMLLSEDGVLTKEGLLVAGDSITLIDRKGGREEGKEGDKDNAGGLGEDIEDFNSEVGGRGRGG